MSKSSTENQEQPRMTPPDEDIVVTVTESLMTREGYNVTAYYKSDPYTIPCFGDGYAQKGTFYPWLGDSLEASLKKATCDAIKDLKGRWLLREKRIDDNKARVDFCLKHIKECEGVGKR